MDEKDNWTNILLLGETGVGKSTFINAFVNYVEHNNLFSAIKDSDLSILIPAKFSIVDENYKEHEIFKGKTDENEDAKLGNSSTQAAKSYKFQLKDGNTINFIDTPGIGDSRGIDQDKQNFEYIMSHLSSYKEVHAICFLLKPNASVITPFFKFCIMELLTHLDKSAADNIIFLFTNTRGTNYKPGDTLAIIKRLIADIEKQSNVKIKCDISGKRNIFCFDNEAFRYVIAKQKNIKYGDQSQMESSWAKSSKECFELLNYIRGSEKVPGLTPHALKNTISINETRKMIMIMSKPLADIAENIEDNLEALKRHKKRLMSENTSMAELKNNLFVPVTKFVETPLTQPVTVCTSQKCSTIYTVFGISKYDYHQKCHNPCYLQNVPKEVVGSTELIKCWAMQRTTNCTQCKCDFSTHMHIYYETQTSEGKEEDPTVLSRIKSSGDVVREKEVVIRKLKDKKKRLEREKEVISKVIAKFANFLMKNSLCPINDAYESYLNYLIEREEKLGSSLNNELLRRYREMKREHLELVEIFKNSHNTEESLKPENIKQEIDGLFNLSIYGQMIKDLSVAQENGFRSDRSGNCHYHHNKVLENKRQKNDPRNQEEDDSLIKEKQKIIHLVYSNQLSAALDLLIQLMADLDAPPTNARPQERQQQSNRRSTGQQPQRNSYWNSGQFQGRAQQPQQQQQNRQPQRSNNNVDLSKLNPQQKQNLILQLSQGLPPPYQPQPVNYPPPNAGFYSGPPQSMNAWGQPTYQPAFVHPTGYNFTHANNEQPPPYKKNQFKNYKKPNQNRPNNDDDSDSDSSYYSTTSKLGRR